MKMVYFAIAMTATLLATAQTTVNDGSTLNLTGGQTVNNLILNGGASATPHINNTGGSNTIAGTVRLNLGQTIGVASSSGTLTVSAPLALGLAEITFSGAAQTTVSGAISDTYVAAGLTSGFENTNANLPGYIPPSNPANYAAGVELGTYAADAARWGGVDYRTWVYTGQVYDADGSFSFGENFDDQVLVKVDGTTVLNNASWNTPTATGILSVGPGPANDGWHNLEIYFHEGDGGAGGVNGTGWTTVKGFGINTTGVVGADGNNFVLPVDPGDGTLLRTTIGLGSDIVVAGPGTTRFEGSNTFDRGVSINGGTLVAANDTALGSTVAGTTINGGTLALDGGVSLSENLTIAPNLGGPDLLNISGTNTVAGTINAGSNYGILAVQSDGGTLQINTPLDIGAQNLTFSGNGDTVVSGIISADTTTPGLLSGYVDTTSNLPGFAPANPGNYGIELGTYAADTNRWAGVDNRTWIYTGQLYDADGSISFGENFDDQVFVTIDGNTVLNNGTWDAPTATGILALGQGPNGDGWHDVAIYFHEGGGGAGGVNGTGWTNAMGFGINTAGTASNNGTNFVLPVDPGDGTLFRAIGGDIVVAGPGTTRFEGSNTFDRGVSVSGGTLIVANNNALGTTVAGTTVNGGTLAFDGGVTVAEDLTVNTAGAGPDLLNIDGTNTLTGTITAVGAASGGIEFRSNSGMLQINGPLLIDGQNLTLSGTADIEINTPITDSAQVGLVSGFVNTVSGLPGFAPANPGNFGVELGTFAAAGYDHAPYWNGIDNRTWIYSGQVYDADGTVSFGENFDDQVFMTIDGTTVLNNGTWNGATATGILSLGMGPANDGWHDVQIYFHEGGGQGGAFAATTGWTQTKGFGINVDGTASNDGTNFVLPVDPGDMSLFRTAPVTSLVKSGTGTVTLSTPNTYHGRTTINGGSLVITDDDALGGAGPTSYTTVNAGGRLSLQGGITTPETLFIAGDGPAADGALHSSGGDNIVNGNLTATADATVQIDDSSLSVNGIVAGSSALTKTGAGTLAFTNSGNTFSGSYDVAEGTMQIANLGALGDPSAIHIAAGAVFDASALGATVFTPGAAISGNGTILAPAGGVGFDAATAVSPGNSPGTMSVVGNLTWLSGATYNWELLDSTSFAGVGGGWDLIDVTGSADFSGLGIGTEGIINVFGIDGSSSPFVNGNIHTFSGQTTSMTILTAAGGILGFDAAGWIINPGNMAFAGYFTLATQGNNLVLTFISTIPEPSTYVLAAVLLGAILIGCRRRERLA